MTERRCCRCSPQGNCTTCLCASSGNFCSGCRPGIEKCQNRPEITYKKLAEKSPSTLSCSRDISGRSYQGSYVIYDGTAGRDYSYVPRMPQLTPKKLGESDCKLQIILNQKYTSNNSSSIVP